MMPRRSALGVAGLALAALTALGACAPAADPGGSSGTGTGAPSSSVPSGGASEPSGWQTSPASPGASTSSTPSETGPGPITGSQLPIEKDLAWHNFGDFREQETGKGSGQTITDCFDLDDDLLGASSLIHRSFVAFDGDVPALAIGLQFTSETEARAGFAAFQQLRQGCVAHLAKTGNPDGRVNDWIRVDTVASQAGFFEFSYPTDGDNGRFESLGAVQQGSRMVLLLMYADGQDSNWSYQKSDDTGLPLHPQLRSLPRVAQRLG